MKYKKYAKVVTTENPVSICAIYEPHPFRSSVISEAVGGHVNTGIKDDQWAWIYYDWCGNPVGCGEDMPSGVEVDMFSVKDFEWLGEENARSLAEYLNKSEI